jgi:hypothetical protein
MALLFMDGFDNYTGEPEMQRGGWTGGAAPSTTVLRRSGVGKSVWVSSTGYMLRRTMPQKSTFLMGVAAYFTGFRASANSPSYGFSFWDSPNDSQCQVLLTPLTDGCIVAGRDLTELGRTAVGVLQLYTWHFIEVKIVISDSVGEVHIRVDGTPVLDLTGKDTKYTANAWVDKIILSVPATSAAVYCDDFYLLDTTGSAPCNDFLRPVFIDSLVPDADGNYEEWSRSAGSDSWALVDDPGDQDDDTTYVYTSTHKAKDTFSLGALPAGGPIKAVNLKLIARKDAASPPIKIRPMARLGGADYIDTVHQNLPESYTGKWKIWELNPADSQAWEPTDIDNGEFGFEMLRTTTV